MKIILKIIILNALIFVNFALPRQVKFHKKHSLKGTITQINGDPVEGLTVIVPTNNGEIMTTTNEWGQYKLRLPAGTYNQLKVVNNDENIDEVPMNYHQVDNKPLVINKSRKKDIQLVKFFKIKGQVISKDGRPLTGVKVAVNHGKDSKDNFQVNETTTTYNGYFSLYAVKGIVNLEIIPTKEKKLSNLNINLNLKSNMRQNLSLVETPKVIVVENTDSNSISAL